MTTHPTPPKSTKPFILACTVIAIVLYFSVSGKACLAVCAVVLVVYSKLEVGIDRVMAEEYNQYLSDPFLVRC